ncbi:MAG: dCTP deaminase, partial [Dehalococcoidia bacterium]
MILSDADIRRALAEGRIVIDPDEGLDERLGPESVDFRLGSSFLVFERNKQPYIDPRRPETAEGTT